MSKPVCRSSAGEPSSVDEVRTAGGFGCFRRGQAPGDQSPRPALPADAAHLVAVGEREESVAVADLVLQALDPRLEELDHPAALIADQVIVVLSGAKAFVSVADLADPNASHDSRVHQELERPIDRGPRDLLSFRSQAHEDLVRLEVLVTGEQLVENGLPLGRELQATPFQVFAENDAFAGSHAIATQSQLQYSPPPAGLSTPRQEGRPRSCGRDSPSRCGRGSSPS